MPLAAVAKPTRNGWQVRERGYIPSQGLRRAREESVAKKEIPQKWTGDDVVVSIRNDVPELGTGKLKEVNDAGTSCHP